MICDRQRAIFTDVKITDIITSMTAVSLIGTTM